MPGLASGGVLATEQSRIAIMQSLRGEIIIEVKDPSMEHGGSYDNLEPFAPAWTYDDIVGSIWGLELGAYDAETGEIYLSDPSAGVTPQWGGSYDNRE